LGDLECLVVEQGAGALASLDDIRRVDDATQPVRGLGWIPVGGRDIQGLRYDRYTPRSGRLGAGKIDRARVVRRSSLSSLDLDPSLVDADLREEAFAATARDLATYDLRPF
jgi:hypothetical protein